ncbi:hypothetical protein AMECASPLE_024603 [Ameca splendens]|uniref:Uncharacterized protein n=1 Tax=Ameca splendens TaxID=208324 RepID=A0ABV0XHC9_9TELE
MREMQLWTRDNDSRLKFKHYKPITAVRAMSLLPSHHFQLSHLQIRRTCHLRSRLSWFNCNICPERRKPLRQSSSAARRLRRKLVREFVGQLLTNK